MLSWSISWLSPEVELHVNLVVMERLLRGKGLAFGKLFFELFQVCDWNKLSEAYRS